MSDILNKTIVLVLNRNWQAINIRTPQDAFCQMATNVATALDIEDDSHIRPVTWDEWITLAGARGRPRRAHRARRDPCAGRHWGGELRARAEEAPEAQREEPRRAWIVCIAQ